MPTYTTIPLKQATSLKRRMEEIQRQRDAEKEQPQGQEKRPAKAAPRRTVVEEPGPSSDDRVVIRDGQVFVRDDRGKWRKPQSVAEWPYPLPPGFPMGREQGGEPRQPGLGSDDWVVRNGRVFVRDVESGTDEWREATTVPDWPEAVGHPPPPAPKDWPYPLPPRVWPRSGRWPARD